MPVYVSSMRGSPVILKLFREAINRFLTYMPF
jgi:hypothetical protein